MFPANIQKLLVIVPGTLAVVHRQEVAGVVGGGAISKDGGHGALESQKANVNYSLLSQAFLFSPILGTLKVI